MEIYEIRSVDKHFNQRTRNRNNIILSDRRLLKLIERYNNKSKDELVSKSECNLCEDTFHQLISIYSNLDRDYCLCGDCRDEVYKSIEAISILVDNNLFYVDASNLLCFNLVNFWWSFIIVNRDKNMEKQKVTETLLSLVYMKWDWQKFFQYDDGSWGKQSPMQVKRDKFLTKYEYYLKDVFINEN